MQQNIRVAVDAVVFGYDSKAGLSVLLIQRKYPPFEGSWAIPGGFVLDHESLEEAVQRELEEEAGVSINYLEQLYSFGQPNRDPRQRVISVAYFGLARPDQFKLKATTDAKDAAWYNIDELPELAFDHEIILEKAIERLKNKATYEPVGFELLPKKFPFGELEKLYRIFLGREIDRRNFRKKILRYGLVEELPEKAKSTGAGRPGNLFQFNEKEYDLLRKQGLYFEI